MKNRPTPMLDQLRADFAARGWNVGDALAFRMDAAVVAENTFGSWQEKQGEATRLINQVKQMNTEGIDSGEKSAEAHKMVAEAQKLMGEVKAEKLTEENSKLAELLESLEKDQGVTPGTKYVPIGDGGGAAGGAPGDMDDFDAEAMFKAQTVMSVSPRIGRQWKMVKDGKLRKGIKQAVLHKDILAEIEEKALAEGTGSAGGFLVPPAYLQNLFAEVRRQGNALRRYGWLAEHPVETNQVLLPRGAGAATFAIVAENATKPSADQTYSQITINIFTWAGISKVSKQLVQDSSPTVADLVNRELGSLAGNLEEQKVINGTGTGEPRGIMNTSGVNNVTFGTNTAQGIIDNLLDAILAIQTTYFAPPNGILMHPRRLVFLQKGKDSQNNYLFNLGGAFRSPGGLGATDNSVTSVSQGTTADLPSIFGLPIGTSVNVPTNLGGGTNQDAIIVANWNEAHWFQRQDITMDVSDQAGTAFESNQVWYRLEERAGFSAERYPAAFAVGTGVGLVP